MTHSAVYCALITKRLLDPISKNVCYVERHHIIPKSEGGSDDPSNLVNLTAREHYIAHLLLAKIYKDFNMYAAVRFMRMKSKFINGRQFKFNSRLYEKMKTEYNKRCKGKVMSQEARLKMSLAKKGKPATEKQRLANSLSHKGKKHSPEHNRKVGEANRGRKLSDEHKMKLSIALKGKHTKPCSEETRRKISLAQKGKPRKKHTKEWKMLNSLRHTGTKWFNNGKVEMKSKECPEGFKKGRLKK